MKSTYRKNITSISLCFVLRLALSVHAELETDSKNDIANIPACVLCANCASAHDLRNKNNSICTLDEDVSNLLNDSAKFKAVNECYEHGDYSDLFDDKNTTFVSILPPYGNKSICKFNISYYVVLNKTFVHDDVLFAKFGLSSVSRGNMMSLYGRWKVEHKKIYRRSSIYRTQNFKFDVTSLTGLQEGHYKLQFDNDVNIDQFYVHQDRKVCTDSNKKRRCGNDNLNFDRLLVEKTINPSWNISSKSYVSPINITFQKQENNSVGALHLKINELDPEFQKCYRYSEMYNHDHDTFSLNISIFCKVTKMYGCKNGNCSCNLQSDTNNDRITMLLEIENIYSCQKNVKEQIVSWKVHANLVCLIYREPYKYTSGIAYIFNQPILFSTKYASPRCINNNSNTVSDGQIEFNQTQRSYLSAISLDAMTNETRRFHNIIKSDVLVTAIVVIAVLVLLGASISWFMYCRVRRKNASRLALQNSIKIKLSNMKWSKNQEYTSISSNENDGHENAENDDSSIMTNEKGVHKKEENIELPDWLKTRSDLIYDSSCVEKGKELGHGNFGSVFEGKIRFGNAIFPVAIKCSRLSKGSNANELLEEAKSMLETNSFHENIVNLQGLTYKKTHLLSTKIECALILEFCSNGNLRSYLIDHEKEFNKSLENYRQNKTLEPLAKEGSEKSSHNIVLLHQWIYQVANGMEFLAKKFVHHGDLAARNILLTESLIAKISDFGLARRLYEDIPGPILREDTEEPTTPVMLPLKWLPLEILLHHKITPEKSDVWSFGVLTWEVFQLGATPYRKGIDFYQLILELKMGVRLPTPPNCPETIADILRQCFIEDPRNRPTFTEIKSMISQSHRESLRKVISVNDEEKEFNAIVQYADLEMESTYLNMRKQNRDFQDKKIFSEREEPLLRATLSSSAPKTVKSNQMYEPLHYSTPMTKSVNSMDSNAVIKKQSVDSPYYQKEYKRYISLSSKDITTHPSSLPEYQNKLTLSKSCPNPLYFLTSDDIECLNQIKDSMVKDH